MIETEIDISGESYRITRLDVPRCFDLARKLAPMLGIFAESKERDPRKFVQAFCAFAAPLSKIDSDMVLETCLGSVARKVKGGRGWQKIAVAGEAMYEDLGLETSLMIVQQVLIVNGLYDFFGDRRSDSSEQGVAGHKSNGQRSQTEKPGTSAPSTEATAGLRTSKTAHSPSVTSQK